MWKNLGKMSIAKNIYCTATKIARLKPLKNQEKDYQNLTLYKSITNSSGFGEKALFT